MTENVQFSSLNAKTIFDPALASWRVSVSFPVCIRRQSIYLSIVAKLNPHFTVPNLCHPKTDFPISHSE